MKPQKQLGLTSLAVTGGLVLGAIAQTEIPFFLKGFVLLVPLQLLALIYIFKVQPSLFTRK